MKTAKIMMVILSLCAMNQWTFAQAQRKSGSGCNCKLADYGCGLDETGGCYFSCANYCCQKFPQKCARLGSSFAGISALDVEVYPNPVSDAATIVFPLYSSQHVTLKIIDVNGRVVRLLADGEMEDGEHEIQWNTGPMDAGVYFFRFYSDEGVQVGKIVVAK